jgi:hypothetical protein
MVWCSFAVEVFWALWDNIITIAMVILLREANYVHALQRSTVMITSI